MRINKTALLSLVTMALAAVGVLLIAKPEASTWIGAGALGLSALVLALGFRKK